MKQKLPLPLMILVAVVVIVLVGAASFYAGTKYSSAKRFNSFGGGNFSQGQQQGNATTAGRRINVGGGMVNGDVLSLDEKSLTVKGRDGSSKMVFFATSTEVGKFATGAVSDLAVGQNVVVTGKTNSDGSVIAQSIQIRPATANPDLGAPVNPVK
ncbi:MAG: hypothetical protein WC473_01095 [Patescibacteria group bacterium]|jgi:cytochrome c-type biogenesis protein CcmE